MGEELPEVDLQRYAWVPQPGPQFAAFTAKHIEILLYGGAKFGGKSDYLLGDYLQDVDEFGRDWQGILIRQSLPELEDIIRRSHEIYPRTGGEWKEGSKRWVWPSGAQLRMRYLENERDFGRYQGHSYPWIGIDEIGQWPDEAGFRMMLGCLRWGQREIPYKRIRCTANPGGPGHHWVRRYFKLNQWPLGFHTFQDDRTGMSVCFIPSKVSDNKFGLAKDPNYINRLRGVGSPELVKAWLEGDWTVISGSFFGVDFNETHLFKPFKLGDGWDRARSFDFGSAKPFSVGWWGISQGVDVVLEDGRKCYFPPNFLLRYREWYGAAPNLSNTGLKLTVREIADGINERSGGESYLYSVADPAIFAEAGGPSIAEEFRRYGIVFRPADNKRVPGWQQLRNRLRGGMIGIFSTCPDLIRTLPALQHDRHKAEDVDSDGEDHAPDETRYMCMSRPYTLPTEVAQPWKGEDAAQTYKELMDRHFSRVKTTRI